MPKIFICSSVQMEYFTYIKTCSAFQGRDVEEVYYLDEVAYRRGASCRGFTRMWFRLGLYLFYPIKLIIRVLASPKKSIYIVTTNTFYAPILLALFGKVSNILTVQLIYDLFPDAMVIAGRIGRQSMLARVMGRLTTWTQRLCSGTVYLGDFLEEHTVRLYGEPRSRAVIDVSCDASLFTNQMSAAHVPIIFHYGGQIGHMHDADTVIAAIKSVMLDTELIEKTRFNFFVSGAQSQYLKESFAGTPTQVTSAVPAGEWRKTIEHFHVGLVTLKPGGATVCLPSKSYGMMAGGLALIAICPEWSDLAQLIYKHEVGWVVSNSPYEKAPAFDDSEYFRKIEEKLDPALVVVSFKACIKSILSDLPELDRRRGNAARVMRTIYDWESQGTKWAALLNEIQQQ